ncbi:hypothetical protein PU560_09770 [Georgenia sp. 10Sc9-8]|uniref:Uncharacterized protein n=1 Tax=Georgenia halotolerans TaxID=3028317 RepID=A0ABT5TXF4_9MICO|nr:hypothetical protein [Georgenia halotolerans]
MHFHVHFAVGRFVPRGLIDSAWGRGWVSIKMLGGLPHGSGALAEARVAARYLSKYATKSFVDAGTRLTGMHRYDLAQGFQPKAVRLEGPTKDAVLDRASEHLGMAGPDRVWSSADVEDWAGPPAIWAQWG